MNCPHHVTEIKSEQLYCIQCGELLVDLVSERSNEPDYEHLHREDEMHWSQRERYGYVGKPKEAWDFGDNNPSDPEQNWERDEQED